MKGQAKKDFEEWCKNELSKRIDTEWGVYGFGCGYDGCDTEIVINDIFDELPPSMQYGVIVDWFDSVGIDVEIYVDFCSLGKKIFTLVIECNVVAEFKTRPQARQKAIENAVEIYNNR